MSHGDYTCLFGGEAGYGIMSAGSVIAKGANLQTDFSKPSNSL